MLHTESRVARLFEVSAVRRDPVNIDVMQLNFFQELPMYNSQRVLSWTLLALVALGLCGCNKRSTAPANSSQELVTLSPPAGSACDVYFRRNLLGVVSDNPISIEMGMHNGGVLFIGGFVVKMDHDWLVLKIDDNTEKWIPRSVILYMTVTSR